VKAFQFAIVVTALCGVPALANSVSLQGALVNSSAAGFGDPTSPGIPALSGNLDPTTGLGTITFTDANAGVGFFDLFVDLSVSQPFFNEFGTTGGGSPTAGLSWQIDVPDYWCNKPACQSLGLPSGAPDPNDPTANIIANTLANTLSNNNGAPGTLANFGNDCGAEPAATVPVPNALCNNDVSLAMGFNYIVAPGSEEVVTLTVSGVAPVSGFYLEQLHPEDAANVTGTSPVFLYGSTTSVPEPSSLSTLTLLLVMLAYVQLRRRRRTTYPRFVVR
jgi:hypothetical protein